MRLAKYLAHAGVASRRASEDDHRRRPRDRRRQVVTDPARDVDDIARRQGRRQARSAIAGHERRSSTASTSPRASSRPATTRSGRRTVVIARRRASERLYPVGRLDVDTTGLILLTNDGDLAHRLTHPRFEVPRTYRARVANAPVNEPALRALRDGVELEDGLTAPAKVRRISSDHLEITIHEGRKRQVKRMLEAVGHPVRSLERVAFGPLELGGLELGRASRADARPEIERLRELA